MGVVGVWVVGGGQFGMCVLIVMETTMTYLQH